MVIQKVTNISFSMKVGAAANVLMKLNYLQSRVETLQKDHIYHTKQYQAFYRKIMCDLLNFREVKNGYRQDYQYLMVSIYFFHKIATLM